MAFKKIHSSADQLEEGPLTGERELAQLCVYSATIKSPRVKRICLTFGASLVDQTR